MCDCGVGNNSFGVWHSPACSLRPLMARAVNACRTVNPANPVAAAEDYPAVVAALRHATYRTHDYSGACAGCEAAHALLARLHPLGHSYLDGAALVPAAFGLGDADGLHADGGR